MDSDRGLPVEDIVASLVNDLDALAGSTVLALDDYHVIDDPQVHDAVAFLLDHLPPQVTLAMTTRADPPLPLSRLRARRAARGPRRRSALHRRGGRYLPQPRHGPATGARPRGGPGSRTEGWAAGLQLAALSARGRTSTGRPASDGVAAFVESFTGSHRFVLDYLLEEVLDTNPSDVRTFLLDTSCLEQLTGGLCDALTGGNDGQRAAGETGARQPLPFPLDDQRQWYRYHHLFADALRARLQAESPTGSLPCTGRPATGTPSTERWPTPSATPSPRAMSTWRPTCWNWRCQKLGSGGTTGPCASG